MRRACFKLLLLFSIITIAAVLLRAASLTHVEDMNLALSLPTVKVPKWSNGSLVTVQFQDPKYPLIWMFNRSGARSMSFSIPGAESTLIYDCDLGSDGTIGISGSATDADGHIAGFVAWVSPNDTKTHVIRTGLYRPAMVAVAPDGTLWTVGKELATLALPPQIIPSAGVIRQFDRSGNTVASFVPQATIRNPILTLSGSRNTLRATKNRVGWYSVDGRYIELSLSGILLTDISVDLPIGDGKPLIDNISFALTDDGEAFLSVPHLRSAGGNPSLHTYVLDRSSRIWKPVQPAGQAPESGNGYIYGADGRRLVVMSDKVVQFYAIGN